MKSLSESKKYLSPEFISKIKSLDLIARFIVEGFMIGLHKSPYHGFSAEFSEHRPYIPGDELTKLDWKIFAKTDKYFLKQFEEETNLKTYILLDKSNSMGYSSKVLSKLQYGIIIASSLSYLMHNQNDAVGLTLFSEKIEKTIVPKASKNYLMEILKTLSTTIPDNSTNTFKCLKTVAEKINKRGLIIIISDFLDNPDSIISALKLFRSRKNEVIIFHLLDDKEINFNFGTDAIFKDLETNDEILTQPFQIQSAYNEAFKKYQSKIESECKNNKIDYNLINTNDSFEIALLAYLKKRKRLY